MKKKEIATLEVRMYCMYENYTVVFLCTVNGLPLTTPGRGKLFRISQNAFSTVNLSENIHLQLSQCENRLPLMYSYWTLYLYMEKS